MKKKLRNKGRISGPKEAWFKKGEKWFFVSKVEKK